MNKKLLPIGMSDFKEIIEKKRYFVDKSIIIKEVINGSKVLLLPRPRRFGKTHLSRMRYFFDCKEDNRYLFDGLKISEEKELMEEYCGKYPVIYLTFKDVKHDNFHACYRKLILEIEDEYNRYEYLIKSDIMNEQERVVFKKLMSRQAEQSDYEKSLVNLSKYIFRYHKQKPVILIDEYDVPIQQGYLYDKDGYYNNIVGFLRNFFSAGIKDNIYFEKAVMTGILRVAKESIFSGMNNLKVHSLISEQFGDKFGFTEDETEEIIRYYGLEYELEEVKAWYNGYNFGGVTIYNPWSILNLVSDKGDLLPYWVNTSSNDLIKDILSRADDKVKIDLNTLVDGETIEKEIDENIIFSDIEKSDNALWNFLLFSGYLKYTEKRMENGITYAKLMIPNSEVKIVYRNILLNWFGKPRYSLESLLKDLTQGGLEDFAEMFEEFCMSCFSYFDISGREPERFYHAFVLGMVVSLRDGYRIKSNRESGLGRYDVMLIPNDKKKRGVIFEFKSVRKKETLETAAESAMKQIENKNYEAELRAEGVDDIVKIAIAFQGKNVAIFYK